MCNVFPFHNYKIRENGNKICKKTNIETLPVKTAIKNLSLI